MPCRSIFPSNNSELHMITSRPIKAGEEVLISYLDHDVQARSQRVRREHLR